MSAAAAELGDASTTCRSAMMPAGHSAAGSNLQHYVRSSYDGSSYYTGIYHGLLSSSSLAAVTSAWSAQQQQQHSPSITSTTLPYNHLVSKQTVLSAESR